MRSLAGISCLSAMMLGLTALTTSAWAQPAGEFPPAEVEIPATVASLNLKGVPPPSPDDAAFNAIVKSKPWLVVLGKALFWDAAVGSDGQACASCHFNAGADQRIINQLNPGLRPVPPDDLFGGVQPASNKTLSGQVAKPNITLKTGDFPFHKAAGPDRAAVAAGFRHQ